METSCKVRLMMVAVLEAKADCKSAWYFSTTFAMLDFRTFIASL